MIRVRDMLPGDAVVLAPGGAAITFVSQTEHPLHPRLRLVVWRSAGRGWHWYHDALDPDLHVQGELLPRSAELRAERLQFAFYPTYAKAAS